MYSRRARGARRATTISRPSTHHLPSDRELTQGLSHESILTINKPVVTPADVKIKIKDLQYIGSYNWTDATPPTIIVPGSPPEWRDRPMPYTVAADTDICFIDQNGFRIPSATLLPLFRAVDDIAKDKDQQDFDWLSVNIVTDRNNLRKLLRWINSSVKDDFRIDMQLAGQHTVLFNRWEKRTRDEGNRAFGHNFEKESTTPAAGCERGTAHHRIISYDLNGLKMVVRFEVDARIPPSTSRGERATPNIDQLTNALSGISISSQSTLPPSSSAEVSNPPLIIIKGGSKVPQSDVVELQTRSETSRYPIDWQESYPQLFLSQTPHHFLGIHARGRFHTCQKRELTSDIKTIIKKSDAQDSLKKLRRALEVIHNVVVQHGQRGRLSLVCKGSELQIFERSSQESCLPDDIMERFET